VSASAWPMLFAASELRGHANLETEFGVKAAELCDFSFRCAEQGYPQPASWLLPAAVVDSALHEITSSDADLLTYPQLPNPEQPPPAIAAQSMAFAERVPMILGDWPLLRSALIRTSVLWPEPAQRPPGVDITTAGRDERWARHLYEGVHKAYADLCRRRWSGGQPTFGMILTERLRVHYDGTAYACSADGGDLASIVLEFNIPGRVSVIAATPADLAAASPLSQACAGELFTRLSDLVGTIPADSMVELEFLFEDSNHLIPVQRRVLTHTRHNPAPFQSRGEYAGRIVDLRTVERRADVIRKAVADADDAALVVAVRDDRHADLFALLWLLADQPELRRPAALVLVRGCGSQAGLPTHLRWLAAAMLPESGIFYLPDWVVPADCRRRLRLSSRDGATVRFSKETS
jgi:hypothetical protein